MKKIIGFLSLASVVTIIACSDKPATVTKEVIVVPSSNDVIIEDPPEKPTTVTVDKNGVKVTTSKVDVRINPDKKKQ